MWESKSKSVIERESDGVAGSHVSTMLHLQRSCNSVHKFEKKYGAKDKILNVETDFLVVSERKIIPILP